ncbi:MAG: CRTAC1 family protein [Planctomycetes bacterium]|jgi:hypothetical protein|nr:CRTAC1 family protein [Planctomycetota bacterium]
MPSTAKKTWIASGLVAALLLATAGAAFFWFRPGVEIPSVVQDPWFEDATDAMGLDFVHDPGDLASWWQPQIHGSGVAIFDFDGDGRLDLYLLNFGGPGSKSTNRLYKNMPDGKFKDVTAGSGLGIDGHNTGVAIGDVNNDGWPDVLVVQHCNVKIFLNRGDGTFRDATEESGLKNPLWGCSASFVDFDRDGWLDLVIVNYLDDEPHRRCYNPMAKRDYCGPTHFPGTVSKLFRNLGANGKGVRFEDVTLKAGFAKAPGPGLAVYCADFTGDGWPDILIVNDNKPNHLWINQKNGTFTEEAIRRGIAVDSLGQAQAGMGVAVGDVDGDGLLDIYMTHLSSERNTLWRQGPKLGYFRDVTADTGLLNSHWRGTGFGTLMADFNHDGWPDLAVVNGRISQGSTTINPALGAHFQQYGDRNQLFRNNGKGKFADISLANDPFCGLANVGRGLACGDLDGDGAPDLVLTTVGNRARIFRNVAKNRGHWLIVRAFDPRLKRDAYGAAVHVKAGPRVWPRVINPADSYQSSSDPRAHFGLGEATRYDSIRIVWPDGLVETFPGGAADRVITLRRGDGK